MVKPQAIQRNSGNPILKINDFKPSKPGLKIIGAFNPGACYFNNETILLVRIAETCEQKEGWIRVPVIKQNVGKYEIVFNEWKADGKHVMDLSDPRKFEIDGQQYLSSVSHLRLARSKDGIHFNVAAEPFLFPSQPDEIYGIEDVRITQIEDIFYLTYTAISGDGHGVNLASTKDFINIKRHGMIFPPQNKDSCLFPEKVNNRYIAFHRPYPDSFGKQSIWYAESPDLIHWGEHSCVLRPRDNKWEKEKIGAGPQPIKTPEGWLFLYHGCGQDSVYTLSLCLLDIKNPRRILKQSIAPVMFPEKEYEKTGFFANVVFSNGWVEHPDGRVFIYYGAADNSVCLAETTVNDLLKVFE